jgi:hypothetical protein
MNGRVASAKSVETASPAALMNMVYRRKGESSGTAADIEN